jgi:multiple sugar transport system substrate-binding protein
MKTKMFAPFTIMAVLVLVLSACQAGTTTQPASIQPGVATGVPEPTQTSKPPEPTQPSKPVEITFWHQWDKSNAAFIDVLVSEFNEANPNIKVKVEVAPGYNEYQTKLRTAIIGGNTPDLASVDLIWVPEFVKNEALQPLDAFISSDSQFDIKDFYPNLTNYDVIAGERYGLPITTNNLEMIWRKDFFTEAGLDPEKPPKTWDEMRSMAEQCSNKAKGRIGFEFYTQPPGEGITWNYQVFLWQSGGEFLNADNTKASFNSPAGLKALTFISDMLKGSGSMPGPAGAFPEHACMQIDGSWLFGYRKGASFDWGIAPIPVPEGGTPATNTGGEHLIMFKNSAHKDAVWKFMSFLTSKTIQMRLDMATGMLPIRKSVGENKAYLDWVNVTEPRMLPFIQMMPYAHTRPATPKYGDVSFAFATEIQKAYLGIASPADALVSAEKAVNEVLSGE